MISDNRKNKKSGKEKKWIAAGGYEIEDHISEKSLRIAKSSPFVNVPFPYKGRHKDQGVKRTHGKGRNYGIIPDTSKKKSVRFRLRCRASATVEAALVTPLFVFALTVLISIITITGVQMRVRQAVYESVRSASSMPYSLGQSAERTNAAFAKTAALAAVKSFFMREMQGYTTAEGLIEGGSGGVALSTNLFNRETASIHVTAMYRAKVPLAFWSGGITVKQDIEGYAWLGDEFMDSSSNEKMVYITPHGTVYHEDINCTYLKPAVYAESIANVASIRNSGGEKYKGCEACTRRAGIMPASVYITRYGNRYHTNPNCVKIKHEVISVPLSQVNGRHKCLKEQGRGIIGN